MLDEWKKLDKHLNFLLFKTLSSLDFQNTTLLVSLHSLKPLVSQYPLLSTLWNSWMLAYPQGLVPGALSYTYSLFRWLWPSTYVVIIRQSVCLPKPPLSSRHLYPNYLFNIPFGFLTGHLKFTKVTHKFIIYSYFLYQHVSWITFPPFTNWNQYPLDVQAYNPGVIP